MPTDRPPPGRGTPHCPNCDMPLFANPVDAGRAAARAGTLRASFIEANVMVAEAAFAPCAELIAAAEALNGWQSSAVLDARGTGYSATRNNDYIFVTGGLDASLAAFEAELRDIFHAGLALYAGELTHLRATSDLGFQLLRYGPGEHFREHVDAGAAGPGVYAQRLVSALLYLNDDYQGGELILPRQNLTYNPKAGTLILFPSGFHYPHESRAVTQGQKYAAVTWFI